MKARVCGLFCLARDANCKLLATAALPDDCNQSLCRQAALDTFVQALLGISVIAQLQFVTIVEFNLLFFCAILQLHSKQEQTPSQG